MWDIKSQSGWKQSQARRHADCDHQTTCSSRLDSKNPWNFSKSVRNRKTRQRFAASCVAPLLGSRLEKKGMIFANLHELLQIYRIAHRTGPSHHLFRMKAKNGDRSPSFGEKSGGSALRNQNHKLSPPSQPLYSLNLIFLTNQLLWRSANFSPVKYLCSQQFFQDFVPSSN